MEFPGKSFLKRHKISVAAAAALVIVSILVILGLLQFARRGAAFIFNREMEKQTMLRGSITVETLMAHITGDVNFENLVWKEPDGDVILHIPEGSNQVRLWDVITRRFKATSIQQLTLKNAVISVRFNENMQVDFLDQKQGQISLPKAETQQKTEKDTKQDAKQKTEQDLEMEWIEDHDYVYDEDGINFDLGTRRLRSVIVLEDCQLAARYKKHHYVLNNVNMKLGLDTTGMSHIDLSTGKFGGTMQGGGMSIYGEINFKPATPVLDVDVSLRDVDPSSLGFGMNVHDNMTVVVRMEGPVTGPMVRGTVKMKELHIPALHFTDVIGDVNYANGIFRFSDVHSKVFGGTLAARGYYDMNTRRYRIFGNGKNLDSKRALRNSHLYCPVDLDINLECNGNARSTVTTGIFKSGKGRYSFVPFDSLQGRFSNRYRELHFYDVKIITQFGTVTTDAFSIVKGKLHLNKIMLTDHDTGKEIMVHEGNKDKYKQDSTDNKDKNDSKDNKDNKDNKNNSTQKTQ